MKTSVMKVKDEDGNEQGVVYGDLTELYQDIEDRLNDCVNTYDKAKVAIWARRYLAEVITESLHQARQRQEEKAKEVLS